MTKCKSTNSRLTRQFETSRAKHKYIFNPVFTAKTDFANSYKGKRGANKLALIFNNTQKKGKQYGKSNGRQSAGNTAGNTANNIHAIIHAFTDKSRYLLFIKGKADDRVMTG